MEVAEPRLELSRRLTLQPARSCVAHLLPTFYVGDFIRDIARQTF
jgi:hypothetical protein